MMQDVRSVYDIGAHVGNFTGRALEIGASFVLAVEPQPEIYKKLKDRYKDDVRVETLQSAVSNMDGTIKLYICRQATTLSSMNVDWSTKGRFKDFAWEKAPIRVEAVTLDTLIEKYGEPDYIKIDVEGAEHTVLSGLSVPIRKISFEFDREFLYIIDECASRLSMIGDYEYTYSAGDYFSYDFRNFSNIMTGDTVGNTGWGMIHARLIK